MLPGSRFASLYGQTLPVAGQKESQQLLAGFLFISLHPK